MTPTSRRKLPTKLYLSCDFGLEYLTGCIIYFLDIIGPRFARMGSQVTEFFDNSITSLWALVHITSRILRTLIPLDDSGSPNLPARLRVASPTTKTSNFTANTIRGHAQ